MILSKSMSTSLGNAILSTIAEHEGLELFKGIGENMTKADPEERPLASGAAQQLEALILGLPASCLRRRIWRTGCSSLGVLDRFLVKYFGAVRWIETLSFLRRQ